MQSTFAWRYVGRLIVVVHTRQDPSRLEWTRFVNAAHERPLGKEGRVLVVSYGGGPDARQRKELADAVKVPVPAVIMTSSVVLRSIGTAFRFFTRQITVVGENDYERAFLVLELSAEESVVARRVRSELEKQLQIPSTR